jgi:hypothetical protein
VTEIHTTIWKEDFPGAPIWGVTWGISAPWAHPIWKQYVAELYDLTTPSPEPPKLYKEGMTHEFVLTAIDPEHKLIENMPITAQKVYRLRPPNMVYQFPAKDNDEAEKRIQGLLDRIKAGTISPDTDFRRMWDAEFQDGVGLVRSAFEPPKEPINAR